MKAWECPACGGNSFTRLDARTVKCDFCETRFAVEADATAGQSAELVRARVVSLVMEADKHYEKREYSDAIELLTKALELDESNHTAWVKLGRAYRLSELYDDSLRCYQKALELEPNNGAAYGNMGVVYMYKKDYAKSVSCLKKSLSYFDPKSNDYAVMVSNLAIVSHEAGFQQEAINLVNQLDKIGYPKVNDTRVKIGLPRVPTTADKEKALKLMQQGDQLYQQDKHADSIVVYRDALKLNDRNSDLWTKLGRAYRLTGDADKALRCYKKALEVNPNDGNAHGNIGVLHHQRGEYVEAIRQFNKALSLLPATSPDRVTMTANLAQATYLSGDRRKGERLLAEAERLGYTNGDAVRKRLGIKPGLFGNLFK